MPPYEVPTSLPGVISYVTAPSTGAQAQSSSTALLHVTHSNLTAVFPELRVSLTLTVDELKDKLYRHTGTRPAHMRVFLHRGGGGDGEELFAGVLHAHGIAPVGDVLRILDDDVHSASASGWLEDTSKVQKYVMSDEDYAKRPDTYAAYRARMRAADPEWTMNRAMAKQRGEALPEKRAVDEVDAAEVCKVSVGDRVEVRPGAKRGVCRFVGRALEALPEGWWVGVEFDEPVGLNDGEVKGVRYFTCGQGFGGMVRPSNTTVGDFPPLDDFDDEDEI